MKAQLFAERYLKRILKEDTETGVENLVEESNRIRDELCKAIYKDILIPFLEASNYRIDEGSLITDAEGNEVEYEVYTKVGDLCSKVLEETPFDFHNDGLGYVMLGVKGNFA